MTPEEALGKVLAATYGPRYLNSNMDDWHSDASYVLERVDGYSLVPTADLDRLRADLFEARQAAFREGIRSADLDRLRAALEVEWFNGNLTDSAHDRLLDGDLSGCCENCKPDDHCWTHHQAALGDRAAEGPHECFGTLTTPSGSAVTPPYAVRLGPDDDRAAESGRDDG